jgi:hypothetical protein
MQSIKRRNVDILCGFVSNPSLAKNTVAQSAHIDPISTCCRINNDLLMLVVVNDHSVVMPTMSTS